MSREPKVGGEFPHSNFQPAGKGETDVERRSYLRSVTQGAVGDQLRMPAPDVDPWDWSGYLFISMDETGVVGWQCHRHPSQECRVVDAMIATLWRCCKKKSPLRNRHAAVKPTSTISSQLPNIHEQKKT